MNENYKKTLGGIWHIKLYYVSDNTYCIRHWLVPGSFHTTWSCRGRGVVGGGCLKKWGSRSWGSFWTMFRLWDQMYRRGSHRVPRISGFNRFDVIHPRHGTHQALMTYYYHSGLGIPVIASLAAPGICPKCQIRAPGRNMEKNVWKLNNSLFYSIVLLYCIRQYSLSTDCVYIYIDI